MIKRHGWSMKLIYDCLCRFFVSHMWKLTMCWCVILLWKNSSCKAKSVLHGTTNGQRFWGLMLQSLNFINFRPGNSKKPGQASLESLRPVLPRLPRKLGLGSNKARKAKLWWPRLARKLGCGHACRALPGRIFPISLAKNPESLAWPAFSRLAGFLAGLLMQG